MPDFFHLVPQICGAQKYFDISLGEIERQLGHSNKFRFDGELILEHDGEELMIPIHLNIGATNGSRAWTMSITLHNKRIDCIDHEPSFLSVNETKEYGWHRHIWDANANSCETRKTPLADLAQEMSLHDFLVRSFQLMGVLLNADDHGNYELQFN